MHRYTNAESESRLEACSSFRCLTQDYSRMNGRPKLEYFIVPSSLPKGPLPCLDENPDARSRDTAFLNFSVKGRSKSVLPLPLIPDFLNYYESWCDLIPLFFSRMNVLPNRARFNATVAFRDFSSYFTARADPLHLFV